jgi:hypothetical protein
METTYLCCNGDSKVAEPKNAGAAAKCPWTLQLNASGGR